MKLGRPLLICIWLLTAAGPVLAWRRLAHSDVAKARAQSLVAEAESNADVIRTSLRRTPRFDADTPVEQDLSARLLNTMHAAGIENTQLKSVRQSRDTAVDSATSRSVRRRAVSAAIGVSSLSQAGAFLDVWESTAPDWTIARVDLQRNAAGDGTGMIRLELVRTYLIESDKGRAQSHATGG